MLTHVLFTGFSVVDLGHFKIFSSLVESSSHSNPRQPDGDEVTSREFVSLLFQ